MSIAVIGVAGVAVSAGAAGYSAYQQSQAQNAQRKQQQAAYGNLAKAPDYKDDWMKAYLFQNAATGKLAERDNKLRQKLAPQQAAAAYDLYAQYAPKIALANRKALAASDPEFTSGYHNLYTSLAGELQAGRGLAPDQVMQGESDIRAAQAARGNVLGNAPVAAEGLYMGNVRDAMYQRRLANMQGFLNGASPESRYGAMLGAGAGFLGNVTEGLTSPGMLYYEKPSGYRNEWVSQAQAGWQGNNGNQMAQARAAYGANPETNPWMASLAAGAGSVGGSLTGAAAAYAGGGGGAGKPGMIKGAARANANGNW